MRNKEFFENLGYEKPEDFYREIGYEEHGYVSPELSSSDTYPPYIEEEVKRCVREIQKNQNHNTITFGFMTDLHLALSYNHNIRMQRTLNAYREIKKRVHIDKLILGGDYTNEGCKEHKSDCFRELRSLFDGIEYFPIHGNHDDGSIWDLSYINSPKSINHLTHKELYNLFYNHIKSLGAKFDNTEEPLYYYVDDEVSKTRYVCLDACDVPYIFENGKLKYFPQFLFAISQSQVNWLVNDALNFKEDGWNVLFFAHSVKLPDEEKKPIDENIAVLNDIINAYKNKQDLKITANEDVFLVNVDAKFSKYKCADVLGVFVGDYHMDDVRRDKSNIPYVFTGNLVMYYAGAPKGQPRTDGDKSELLFDIVTIDKEKRKIFVTRVGAGKDREIDF